MNEPVLSLSDLTAWPRPGTHLAVLGHPIKHSISPPMHNAALAELAKADPQFADWKYHRFEVHPVELPSALKKFKEAGFLGLNLTIPHKVIAFELVMSNQHEIGAVNTLIADEIVNWYGENTDGYGLETSLSENLNSKLEGSDILLLGAGGAARSAAILALQRKCKTLWICNRTEKTRDDLYDNLLRLAWHQEIQLKAFGPECMHSDLPPGLLVINATSAGLKPADAPPIDLASLPRPRAVFDMIYNPAETKLLAQARALGIPAANGLGMLVHQGARSLQHWIKAATGRADAPIPTDVMRAAAEASLAAH